MNGLPAVRIDDILIHPRDNDLIAGTHGRSIVIVDDITPLQQLTDAVMAADAHLFDIRPATRWEGDIMLARGTGGAKHFRGENPQAGTAISYYLKAPAAGDVKIAIAEMNGAVVRDLTGTTDAGINRVHWNLSRNPPPQAEGRGEFGRGGGGGGRGGRGGAALVNPQAVPAGTYVVTLSVGGRDYVKTVTIDPDTDR